MSNQSMTISASQAETEELCRRKWWFEKGPLKLRMPRSTQPQVYGTCLHAVAERYLNADDQGYDADGNPVDLYPEGWHIARNQFTGEIDGELNQFERDQIKKLIAKAIEEGVIERRPGREVEYEFRDPVISYRGVDVEVMGFIDVLLVDEGGIEDHKTAKEPKWFKSAEKLSKNIQGLLYAKKVLDRLKERGRPIPPLICIRHNQFSKSLEKPAIRKTEAYVTPKAIEENWNRIVETAKRMVDMKLDTKSFEDIPKPPGYPAPCNAYGGCPYRGICTGRENVDQFKMRVDRAGQIDDIGKRKLVSLGITRTINKGETMSTLTERLQARRNAAKQSGGSINPTQVDESPKSSSTKPAEKPAAVVEPTVVGYVDEIPLVRAPWVDDSNLTPTNGGIGFNPAGTPDKIAVVRGKKAGLPSPDLFEHKAMGDGTIVLFGKEDTEVAGTTFRVPYNPNLFDLSIEAQEAVAVFPDGEVPEVRDEVEAGTEDPVAVDEGFDKFKEAVEQDQEPETQEEPAEDKPKDEKKSKRGRPKKGMTLLVNCNIVMGGNNRKGSGNKVYHIRDIIKEVGENIAKKAGQESIWDLDFFQRRDSLVASAAEIAEIIGSDMLVADGVGGGQSEIRALLDALEPYADVKIVATAM